MSKATTPWGNGGASIASAQALRAPRPVPSAYYKFHVGEGGMRVPLDHCQRPGPGQKGQMLGAFSWATDLAPTLLAAAGVSPPKGRFAGRPVLPMTGKNLLPLLRGEASQVYDPSETIGYELTGMGFCFRATIKRFAMRLPLATIPGRFITSSAILGRRKISVPRSQSASRAWWPPTRPSPRATGFSPSRVGTRSGWPADIELPCVARQRTFPSHIAVNARLARRRRLGEARRI